MSKIETLVKDNEHLYPRTVEKAIYDDNGVRLDNKINQLTTDVNSKCNANLISDAYSSSKTYSVGDYCIYQNQLYRCITQCQGVLPTDSNYFVQTSVGEEVKTLDANSIKFIKVIKDLTFSTTNKVILTDFCQTNNINKLKVLGFTILAINANEDVTPHYFWWADELQLTTPQVLNKTISIQICVMVENSELS